MSTYADAAGAFKAWGNARTSDLVGAGRPLQMGLHLRHPGGGASSCYGLIEELPARHSDDSAEDPDMLATLSVQVYGPTREAATEGAVALAEAVTSLQGMPAVVGDVKLWASDDVQGPTWAPDGDQARLIVQATIRMTPFA